MTFTSKHNLELKEKEEPSNIPDETRMRFQIGTCHGMYEFDSEFYNLFAITNREKGNGHFDDVLEWFEYMSKRDKKIFLISWVENEALLKHLLEKRGFIPHGLMGAKKVYSEQ